MLYNLYHVGDEYSIHSQCLFPSGMDRPRSHLSHLSQFISVRIQPQVPPVGPDGFTRNARVCDLLPRSWQGRFAGLALGRWFADDRVGGPTQVVSCSGSPGSHDHSIPRRILSTAPRRPDEFLRVRESYHADIIRRSRRSIFLWFECSAALGKCTSS